MTPHQDILRALDAAREAAERQQIALEQMDLALQVTDLERLIREATCAARIRPDDTYYPRMHLGALDEARFAALCDLLETTPDEVVRRDYDDASYFIIVARRHGVWFYAQRSVPRLAVVDTLAGIDPMVSP